MTTKEKIRKEALHLFNEKGVREVSTRMISERAGISQGNLTYHFTKKDDIIYDLYLELVKEMDAIFKASVERTSVTVKDIYENTLVIYQTLSNYRFCMIDFVQLMRDIPRINKHYKSLMEFRKTQFEQLFMACIHFGIFKPEDFPGQYAKMGITMGVFGDYWLSHAEILFEGSAAQSCEFYLSLIHI